MSLAVIKTIFSIFRVPVVSLMKLNYATKYIQMFHGVSLIKECTDCVKYLVNFVYGLVSKEQPLVTNMLLNWSIYF